MVTSILLKQKANILWHADIEKKHYLDKNFGLVHYWTQTKSPSIVCRNQLIDMFCQYRDVGKQNSSFSETGFCGGMYLPVFCHTTINAAVLSHIQICLLVPVLCQKPILHLEEKPEKQTVFNFIAHKLSSQKHDCIFDILLPATKWLGQWNFQESNNTKSWPLQCTSCAPHG